MLPLKKSYLLVFFFLAIFSAGIFFLLSNLINDRQTARNLSGTKEPFSEEYPNSKITAILGSIRQPYFPEKKCEITSYGSGEPSVSRKITASIESAIEDCSQKGGGTVIIPSGRWLTGPIRLKSNIRLELSEGAELYFSNNLQDYLPPVFSRFQGIEYYGFSPLIYANGAENIAITGHGKIFGNGEAWQAWGDTEKSSREKQKLFEMGEAGIAPEKRIFSDISGGMRPSFIVFINSKNILLSDFMISGSPMWTIHMIYS